MERDNCNTSFNLFNVISTHTLTWSVTIIFACNSGYRYDFNSHAHVERDSQNRANTYGNANFNSHAHVERDAYYIDYYIDEYISTHTLTWSVTYRYSKGRE